jgi:hypothetical protein
MPNIGSMEDLRDDRYEQCDPAVGVPVTISIGSDRYPGTIVKVTPCQIHVQEDEFRLDRLSTLVDQDSFTFAIPMAKS